MQVERISQEMRGKRESNTLVTYLYLGYNPEKSGTIPNSHGLTIVFPCKVFSDKERPMAHQLVGRVMAYQGYDE